MSSFPYFTVFTPTYNRAYILERLYRSLQRQTFRDFEWLIVDDGSTDPTWELVMGWKQENNDFTIRYEKQKNGGKCRAINRALDLAQGKMFLVVDSDDYLTDDALEKLSIWESQLPSDLDYCGVAGNLGTSETETSNRLFPEGFFDGTLLDRYGKVDGERAMAFYTERHRQYPYPVFEGEKFMTEAVAYNRMAHDGYRMRFYNDIICVYEYREDGLTKAGKRLFLNNPKGYGLCLREKAKFTGASLKSQLRMWYTFSCDMNTTELGHRLSARQCAEYIGAPLPAIYLSALIHAVRKQLKGKW